MTTNQIEYLKSQETERHNREMEKYNQDSLAELAQHNRTVEAETARHNFGDEGIRTRANEINYFSAAQQAQHQLRGDIETNRANLAKEAETNRSNLAYESIGRSNASANLMQGAAALRQAAVAESNVPINAKKASAEYSQAQTAAKRQETYQQEVTNQNLFRDVQRLNALRTSSPNVENIRSQTDLNRSREVNQEIQKYQSTYDYLTSPADKILQLQNQLGSGVGYTMGRMYYGQSRNNQNYGNQSGSKGSETLKYEASKRQEGQQTLNEFDRVLNELRQERGRGE